MTAGAAKISASPGREQPGADRSAAPGVPAARHRHEAARLAADLPCEVTPEPTRPGLYEAKWESGIMIGTPAEVRAFFRSDGRAH